MEKSYTEWKNLIQSFPFSAKAKINDVGIGWMPLIYSTFAQIEKEDCPEQVTFWVNQINRDNDHLVISYKVLHADDAVSDFYKDEVAKVLKRAEEMSKTICPCCGQFYTSKYYID